MDFNYYIGEGTLQWDDCGYIDILYANDADEFVQLAKGLGWFIDAIGEELLFLCPQC